jgi:hypothetical protein
LTGGDSALRCFFGAYYREAYGRSDIVAGLSAEVMLVMFVCVHPLLLTLLLHLTLGVEFPSDLTDTGEHILQGGCGERIARIETALEAQSRFF